MKVDIVIVGAGLSGATAARILAEKGYKVFIIERLKHIAGHCYDYKNEFGISIHKYGPHIFHTNDKETWDFVNKFSKFRYYQHRVLSYVEGNYVPFPVNRTTLSRIFGLKLYSTDVKKILQQEIDRSNYIKPPLNFRDAVVSQMGEKLYSLFYKNYTIKQWQTHPENISADLAKRIPIRENDDNRYFADKYQGIPLYGYTKLVESILDHENISILLGQDYFEIKEELKSDILIYTGELDRYFNYKYGKLEYRSLDLKIETYEKEYFQQAAVINYPNDYDWTRITEFKYFLDEKSSKTSVCFEYPKASGEPYYIVMTKENIQKRDLYLQEVKRCEEMDNVFFIGRLAEYRYYNMDQVIKAAVDKVNKNILSK
ncbi:MAG: UDP-galactopyranose mutase [Spirochaetales bacterium]|nr:UDP-galactopyranose mutase [Spirochaetales bacterium]